MFWFLLAWATAVGTSPGNAIALERYHPLTVGTEWTYLVTEDGESKRQRVRVESNPDGRHAVLRSQTGGRSLRYVLLRVDDAWCLRRVEGRVPGIGLGVERGFSPPVPFLRIPEPGRSLDWSWSGATHGWGPQVTRIDFKARHGDPGDDVVEVHASWFAGDRLVAQYTAFYGAGTGLVSQTGEGYAKYLAAYSTVTDTRFIHELE
jgi:hypothetical protein